MPLDELSDLPHAAQPATPRVSAEFKQPFIDVLDEDHCRIFVRAIKRVLATDVAEITYAQVIDGLPLARVLRDCSDFFPIPEHPIYTIHKELCPGILEKTRKFRSDFNPHSLEFDSIVSRTPRLS